ncbi:MAG: TPM domain-containing protein [Candidatus Omnitrophica bacterium]|nr:TPM domain-containing protein [Candidatus Omnitrophota bacterium]MDD5489035.1 TPM domain-containing protein [Candidatus Omnitrophota bacterium]
MLCLLVILLAMWFRPSMTPCLGQEDAVPGRTDKWVNDYAGIIDGPTEYQIENRINELVSLTRSKTQDPVEVIIGTFDGTYGMSFSDLALAYAEKWHSSRYEQRDNGVVIVVVPSQRKVTVGVGRNLDNVIPTQLVTSLIQDVMVPEFSKGDYSMGLRKAVEIVCGTLEKADIPKSNAMIFVVVAILLSVAALTTYLVLRRRKVRQGGEMS